jgi:hypothetical protein
MRISINILSKKALLFCLLLLSLVGEAQNLVLTLQNQTSTQNTFDFDLMLTVPAGGRRIYSVSCGVNFNVGILNGGNPSVTTSQAGGASFNLVPGTRAAEFAGSTIVVPNTSLRSLTLPHLRIVQASIAGNFIDLAAGTYRVGTFRFTNTVNWTASSNANLWISPTAANPSPGGTNAQVGQSTFGVTGSPTTNTTISTPTPLQLSHSSSGSTFSVPLNTPPPCPTAVAASGLVAESPCAGAANGSAVITLTGAPNASAAVTYTVDGGAVQNATLSSSAFTVSSLSAGNHVVAVTYPGCTAVSTSSFTIDAGTALTTNGSVTTSICEGASYTWPANGQSYTTAQSGTTFVSGCNTATLNLSITPVTTTGSVTTSICAGASYTWPANGQSYTTAQSGVTVVDGCNTATLNLSITPATTTGSVTTSICAGASYTWPANGQSYTTAQSGVTVVDGCNTATLNLSITPVTTTGSESVTACGTSYTWAVSGQSYNASGSYDFVSGCNTATLTLVLNTSAQTFYADTDGDGFGAGAAILSCEGQPEGTSTNNTDCAPANPLAWRTGNFFVDGDSDGYNNGFPAAPVCYGATTPSGFVAVNNGVDCDDNNASVNPNASEILGNEIDDNCDGTADEVTPLSSLTTASCGTTLTNLSNIIYARQLPPTAGAIQGYRFRVTNGATVRTIDRAVSSFSLNQLPGGATYATTYTIEVSVKSNGFFRAYGAPCTVTTPAVPNTTFVSNPSCGSTLTNLTNSIFCVQAPGASGYRFRVRNGATVVGVVDRTINRFSLMDLGVSNIEFGTTYTIDVLLAFGGNLRPESEYGPTCTITTPASPGTSHVIQPSCGSTINNRWTIIYAQQIVGAQGYKFVVTNGAQTREFVTANPRFQLPQLAGGVAQSTAYTIRVDVLYNSSYVQGTVLCTINTSATARQTNADLAIYDVSAYPNPYAETFKLNVNTSSEDQVSVQVYDMLGRQVEARQASVANITNLEIGSQYPSGVYNIVVTQGSNVKTVRVVKR